MHDDVKEYFRKKGIENCSEEEKLISLQQDVNVRYMLHYGKDFPGKSSRDFIWLYNSLNELMPF